MKSSSLLHLKEMGIPEPYKYRDAIIHDWFLQLNDRIVLETHFLKWSEFEDFYIHIKDGEINVNTKSYSLIWINSPEACRKHGKILLSFRYCRYLERGYVLVKKMEGDSNEFRDQQRLALVNITDRRTS